MRPLPQQQAFTHAQLAESGWTRSAVRNALRTRRIVRVRHGVYSCVAANAGPDTPPRAADLAIAAALAYPQATISHRSALLLHDLPLLTKFPTLPELTVPPRASVTMPGTHPHRAVVADADHVLLHGVRVTTVARTVVDVARNSGLDAGVTAIDAALHRRMTTAEDIEQVLSACRNWPGIRRARLAYARSDDRAESPLESISRLAFPRLGLPAPRPQADILDEHGRFLGRSDFAWDELGVVGEADGLLKYRDPDDGDALVREKGRQEVIERTGLVMARWGWSEARRHPAALRQRVLDAFERAAARDRAGLPRRWQLPRTTR